MKNYFLILCFITSLLSVSCNDDEDPCDVNHIIVNDECIPDYIFPSNENLQNGDKYYHKEFGVIIYSGGHWLDERNDVIKDLEIKTD